MNTWASTGGSGIQTLDRKTGRYVDYGSPEALKMRQNQAAGLATLAQQRLNQQQTLADAEVDVDAQNYEAEQNRAAGQQAFQYALSQSGGRRTPGGGIARGGYGRRGMSLNQATGGLSAANAAARRASQQKLANARLAVDPANQQLQARVAAAKTSAANTPAYAKPRKIGG